MWILCLFTNCVRTETTGSRASRHFRNCVVWPNGMHIYCWFINEDNCIVCGGHRVYGCVCFVKSCFSHKSKWFKYMASIRGIRPAHVWCTNVFVACLRASVHVCVFELCWQTPWNFQCETEVLTATAQTDPSVVELSICDFKAWLMDADLAPCSLSVPFSIYQPRDVSWFTPLSLFHFLLVEHSTRVHLGPL